MNMTAHGWKVFDASLPVLTYEYSFGPGTATSLAVKAADGVIVISPPCGVGRGVYADLEQFGGVCALIAPNAYHHLGLPRWSEQFPRAKIFAPRQSIDRLKRLTRLPYVEPLSRLDPLLDGHVEVVDMPHYKSGEALVCVQTGRGLVWYMTDAVVNLPALPKHPLAWLLFKLTGSAPGLKFNNLAAWVMVKDVPALKQWLADRAAAAPPKWLIPSHGNALELGPQAEPLRRLFAAG